MSLTKQERIALSGKISGIKDEKALADSSIAVLTKLKEKAEAADAPNKTLADQRTLLINSYQDELEFIDGVTRTKLTESILLDSARNVLGNSFFPNDRIASPSVPTGIWTKFVPLANTHAVGKNKLEVFPSENGRGELDIISDMNDVIGEIESELISHRATGKKGESTGSCSGETPAGSGTTQPICIANGGIWTSGPDIYVSDPIIQGLLSNLVLLVQEWEDSLNNQKNIITPIVDKNSTRSSLNQSAILDINNAILVIDNWQSIQNFDTTTPLPTYIYQFDAMVESNFQQTKLQPTTLQLLKDEIAARNIFATNRESLLIGQDYLGSVTQNLSDGLIIDTKGLYGERMLFIDMRINAVAGTLTEVIALGNSQNAQDQIKKSCENSEKGGNLVMKAVKLSAPGIGTSYINVENIEGFSVNDKVFLVADDQEELVGGILEIQNNRVKLTFDVSKRYDTSNNSRIYKLL